MTTTIELSEAQAALLTRALNAYEANLEVAALAVPSEVRRPLRLEMMASHSLRMLLVDS